MSLKYTYLNSNTVWWGFVSFTWKAGVSYTDLQRINYIGLSVRRQSSVAVITSCCLFLPWQSCQMYITADRNLKKGPILAAFTLSSVTKVICFSWTNLLRSQYMYFYVLGPMGNSSFLVFIISSSSDLICGTMQNSAISQKFGTGWNVV